VATVDIPALPRGLTQAEVVDRRARGLGNDLPDAPTRTVKEIVRANIFTYFNALLGGLLLVILIVGPLNDALFGGVIIANSAIGIIQELRAKWTLDRLAVLSSPKARVIREGTAKEIAVNEVVMDDLLELQPGDQIVVDGITVESNALEVDESLLTGESDAVAKGPGEEVLSGSFVAAGGGTYRAVRVGKEAYASQLAEEARKFTLASSELQHAIDLLVRLASYFMLPTGILLLISQLAIGGGVGDALRATVGGVVAMVPEGLVLLTSVAFAVAVVRLARKRVLVQELPAVETLARVDVICLDKTGTLTEGDLALDRVVAGPGVDADLAARALAALVAADPNPNATLRAIGQGLAERDPAATDDWAVQSAVPFSSARKWSAATFTGEGTWLLGAPDVLLRDGQAQLRSAVETYAERGKRVVLLARSSTPVDDTGLPAALQPAALALLEDRVRDAAPATLGYFAQQGVIAKVISGDHPSTVAAVARRAGLEVDGDAIDAATLPTDPEALADALEAGTVFGRVTPHQKRAMVGALQARGHVVAMTGDGVNDVLALKDADIGIAMGAGSSATRAAAQLVLLDNDFSTLPSVVGEGRRVINNIERVANLFITKTVYSMLLALAVGVVQLPFPFLPRHLTLVGSLTIGIPAFFLALAPNARRAQPRFVGRVLRFAVPCGLLAAAATFTGYYIARLDHGMSLDQQRTLATLVLVAMGLLILVRLSRPLTTWRKVLVLAMVAAFALVLALPFGRKYFALSLPSAALLFAAVGVVALAAWILHLADRLIAAYRAPYERAIARRRTARAGAAGNRGTASSAPDPPEGERTATAGAVDHEGQPTFAGATPPPPPDLTAVLPSPAFEDETRVMDEPERTRRTNSS
jgi:cation-transporting ATPase E